MSNSNNSNNNSKNEQDDKKVEQPKKAVALQTDQNRKHPLQNCWVLWYDNPGKKTSQHSWGSHLKKIYSFNTVEDFWRLWNNLYPPSELTSGSNYSLFKEGIEPKWEDEANARGGKWLTVAPKTKRKEITDNNWRELVLACIGEVFEFDADVCGAVVSIRNKQDKVALWTRDSDEIATRKIGSQFKKVLKLEHKVGYQSHQDAMRRDSSFNNQNKYET